MKKLLLLFTITVISCNDLSIFETEQSNVYFYQNTIKNSTYNNKLRVATFNIQMGFCQQCNPFSGNKIGGDYTQLDKISEVILASNADVIALQEVAQNWDLTIVKEQIKYIANKTKMNYAFGMQQPFINSGNLSARGLWGNAILSKYEITSVKNPSIRYIDNYNQNHLLIADIKLSNNKTISIFNTHFKSGSTNNEKQIQVKEVNYYINQQENPVIFMADLNIPYTENNEFLSILTTNLNNSLHKISSVEKNSIINHGTYLNGAVLDYIFTSKNDFTIQYGKLIDKQYHSVSDHFMYFIDILE